MMAVIGRLYNRFVSNVRSIIKKVTAGIKLANPIKVPANICSIAAIYTSLLLIVIEIEFAKESLINETGSPQI